MATADTDKLLREMAQIRGFKLVKSRRRKPGGDHGRYGLKDAKTGKPCFGMSEQGLKASADEIEKFLRGRTKSDWKSSLSAPDLEPKPASRRRARGPKPHELEPPARRATGRSAGGAVTKRRAAAPPGSKLHPKLKTKPKPQLVIREATSKDAAGIAGLIEEKDAPGTRKIAGTIAALAKQGKPVLVADEGGIVGAVSYDLVTPLHHPAPLGRITFLVTVKTERRQGIGGKLLEQAEARLRKLGCGVIELVNNIELSNANSFLRGHGYHRNGYRFARAADVK